MKRLKQALRQLRNGVTIHRGRKVGQYFDHPPLTLKLLVQYYPERNVHRVAILAGDQVAELYENGSLNELRKLTMAYYPSAAKYFGPARLYVGL